MQASCKPIMTRVCGEAEFRPARTVGTSCSTRMTRAAHSQRATRRMSFFVGCSFTTILSVSQPCECRAIGRVQLHWSSYSSAARAWQGTGRRRLSQVATPASSSVGQAGTHQGKEISLDGCPSKELRSAEAPDAAGIYAVLNDEEELQYIGLSLSLSTSFADHAHHLPEKESRWVKLMAGTDNEAVSMACESKATGVRELSLVQSFAVPGDGGLPQGGASCFVEELDQVTRGNPSRESEIRHQVEAAGPCQAGG
mmetsp:Transcript_16436/g.45819  ORF Transcript_16436/g.45819 Transcript_16436/m.45819 type:complete len:254 (+) Transcript_16436:107-868(+)